FKNFIFIEKKLICLSKSVFHVDNNIFENHFHYLRKEKVQDLNFYIIKNKLKKKKMTTLSNEKQTLTQLELVSFIISFQKSEEERIQVIIQHWIRILEIKLGWINELDKLVVNYISIIFMFETFCSSSKLINTFTGHIGYVICSGSDDNTIRFWDIRSNKNELYMIKGDKEGDNGILCLKFIVLKKKKMTDNIK
ncbi:hypothetical protein RFI_03902, partial [Reticulomyxa filosa]